SAGYLDQGLFFATLRDAGERKKNEQEALDRLNASVELQRELVERSNSAVAVVQDGTYLHVNRAFLDLFGFNTPEEIIGREYTAVQSEPKTEWLKEGSGRKDSGPDRPRTAAIRSAGKDGAAKEIEVAFIPVRHHRGKYILYLRDVTREKGIEGELHRRVEEQGLLRKIVAEGAG